MQRSSVFAAIVFAVVAVLATAVTATEPKSCFVYVTTVAQNETEVQIIGPFRARTVDLRTLKSFSARSGYVVLRVEGDLEIAFKHDESVGFREGRLEIPNLSWWSIEFEPAPFKKCPEPAPAEPKASGTRDKAAEPKAAEPPLKIPAGDVR